jgi:MATE family multidrug resistance protein
MFAAIFGYWGVGFPIGYVLAFHFELGAKGLWCGLAAGVASVAILNTWRFRRISRRLVSLEVKELGSIRSKQYCHRAIPAGTDEDV